MNRIARYVLAAVILSAAVVGVICTMSSGSPTTAIRAKALACDLLKRSAMEKNQCWFGILYGLIKADGIGPTFDAYGYMWGRYPQFSTSGCHERTHALGDLAYYGEFLNDRPAIDAFPFRNEMKLCGYGFFHGFFEHYFQNAPDPKTAAATCERLRARLGAAMPDIETICFQGVGHGFMQSRADTVKKSEWGNGPSMIEPAMRLCDALPATADALKERCRDGVFFVLIDWMENGDFGLKFDERSAFSLCDNVRQGLKHACFEEVAQRLVPLVQDHPLRVEQDVMPIRDERLRQEKFDVIMQQMMKEWVRHPGYERIAQECAAVSDDALRSICTKDFEDGVRRADSLRRL